MTASKTFLRQINESEKQVEVRKPQMVPTAGGKIVYRFSSRYASDLKYEKTKPKS